jgi:hypothetical protein
MIDRTYELIHVLSIPCSYTPDYTAGRYARCRHASLPEHGRTS